MEIILILFAVSLLYSGMNWLMNIIANYVDYRAAQRHQRQLNAPRWYDRNGVEVKIRRK